MQFPKMEKMMGIPKNGKYRKFLTIKYIGEISGIGVNSGN